MKTIKIMLKGQGEGLLMNSAQSMTELAATKNPTQAYNKEEEAEKVAYRNKKSQLYIPSRAIKGMMLNASAWYKFGKKSAKQVIAGCTRITPGEIVLLDNKNKPMTKYEIDSRPVVVNNGRSRIIRHRPLINDWKVEFELTYNEEMLPNTNLLREILEEGGNRIGLLDNRPHKYGENGGFTVEKFLPMK